MKEIIYLVPGFVSYILLRPFGFFKFDSNLDRQLTLLVLSTINSVITMSITNYSTNLWIILFCSIVITVLYFVGFFIYRKYLPSVADKLNMNLYDNQGTLEYLLSKNYPDGKKVFIISFDFDDNYIASGYVFDIDDQGNQQIGLKIKDEEKYTISEANDLCIESDENSLVIDYEKKVKNYIIIN